jgi:hypothetical protein
MRRFVAMSLVLFLCAGFTPTGSTSSRAHAVLTAVRTASAAMTAGFIVKRIRARLTNVRNEIPARRAQLHAVQCGSHECYEFAEVTAAVAAIRKDVAAAFSDERAAASRISLDEEIEDAAAAVATEPPASIQLIRNGPGKSSSKVDARNADTIFGRIDQRIDHYLAHPKLNPTIQLTCNVVGATFDMQVGSNAGTNRHTLTNHAIPSVWRGRYRGRALMPNYRASDDEIDLFNHSQTKVQCKLVPLGAGAAEQSHCWLED